ncbi:MAG: DUF255 domain-containing protein [Nitrospinota bacterium]|nr:DUF255 domain-containing protein [Nitrospinota bacterium]
MIRSGETTAVNWLPWGHEAFGKAREENKLLFVSIGYPACRGLVLLERELFWDTAFIELVNSRFVPVRMDREMLPATDFVYMTAAMAIRKEGGWPNNMFLTPSLDPVLSVGYGKPPDIVKVMNDVDALWLKSDSTVRTHAAHVGKVIKIHLETVDKAREEKDPDLEKLRSSMDIKQGGFGAEAKFPMVGAMEFLLMESNDDGFVKLTLDKMSRGGMFDHVGGGFFRCTVDRNWGKPQFEKLLCDNALLASLYSQAALALDDGDYEFTARKTLEFIEREFGSGLDGGFAGSIGDDGAEDGEYYTWSMEEARKVAQDDQFLEEYGITEKGDISLIEEAGSIPKITQTGKSIPRRIGVTLRAEALARMKKAREARRGIFLDGKVIAAWQGMAISAFARAAVTLDDSHYLAVALRAGEFAIQTIGWSHCVSDGKREGRINLEDGAYLAMAYWDLFEATGEEKWLAACRDMTDASKEKFATGDGGYFMVENSEGLIARPRNYEDQPYPSAAAVLGRVDWRLSIALGRTERAKDAADTAINLLLSLNGGGMLGGEAMSLHREVFSPTVEILYSFAENELDKRRWVQSGHHRKWGTVRIPLGAVSLNRVLSFGRKQTEVSRAFVCFNSSCDVPARSPDELETMLDKLETE